MKNPDRLENFSRSKVATLCAGSVYPLTGGNDSSRDYWRVTKDKDGKVIKVQDDGDYTNFNFVDEEGNSLGSEHITAKRMTAGELSAIVKNGQTMEDLSGVMRKSGLSRTEKDGWFAVDGRGVYSTYANSAHPSYQRMNDTETERREYQEKNTSASERDIEKSVDRAKEMLGLPYGSSDRKFDETNVVLKTSKTVDCIGLISYGTGTPITDTAINFGKNPYFMNVGTFKDSNIQLGDIMQVIYSTGELQGHVMMYLGSTGPLIDPVTNKPATDQILEAYSYHDPISKKEVGKVRYNTYTQFKNSLAKFSWEINSVNIYRRNQYNYRETK